MDCISLLQPVVSGYLWSVTTQLKYLYTDNPSFSHGGSLNIDDTICAICDQFLLQVICQS